jgi:hypothetical protein
MFSSHTPPPVPNSVPWNKPGSPAFERAAATVAQAMLVRFADQDTNALLRFVTFEIVSRSARVVSEHVVHALAQDGFGPRDMLADESTLSAQLADNARLERALAEENHRIRRATQRLGDTFGASGPLSLEEVVARAEALAMSTSKAHDPAPEPDVEVLEGELRPEDQPGARAEAAAKARKDAARANTDVLAGTACVHCGSKDLYPQDIGGPWCSGCGKPAFEGSEVFPENIDSEYVRVVQLLRLRSPTERLRFVELLYNSFCKGCGRWLEPHEVCQCGA